jgi:predicted RNA-binding Zn-ribbon protein involved in translation (DUF1610 family)
MEKFGVETVTTNTQKEAADKQEAQVTCPSCGAALLPWEDNNVPRCPACGTRPFEAK